MAYDIEDRGGIEGTKMPVPGRSGQFRIMVRARGQRGIKPKNVLTYYGLVNMVLVPGNFVNAILTLLGIVSVLLLKKKVLLW